MERDFLQYWVETNKVTKLTPILSPSIKGEREPRSSHGIHISTCNCSLTPTTEVKGGLRDTDHIGTGVSYTKDSLQGRRVKGFRP